jgi:excisionase family DNA binding protein
MLGFPTDDDPEERPMSHDNDDENMLVTLRVRDLRAVIRDEIGRALRTEAPPLPAEAMLTPKRTAKALGVSERTILLMLNDGRLSGIRVGGRWRIRRTSVEAILEGRSDAA